MTNKFERILLSILLGTSVLMGLSFWLNIIYGFNLFYSQHWAELSRLQAEHTPISNGFYISIGVAIAIFIFGMVFIYVSGFQHKKTIVLQQHPDIQKNPQQEEKSEQQNIPIPTTQQSGMPVSRPPRLNLPSNMAQIVAQRQQQNAIPTQAKQNNSVSPYNSILEQIFTDKGFTVKPNPKISGFAPNLFAIAPNEILFVGAVDQDMSKLQSTVEKLQSLFQETLEDIPINITAFMLDTVGNQSTNDYVYVFKSVEELKEFIPDANPLSTEDEEDLDKGNFDAYSEYIDTIIQYFKNTGS